MPTRAELQALMQQAEADRRARMKEAEQAVIAYFVTLALETASQNTTQIVTSLPACATGFQSEEVVELLQPHFPDCEIGTCGSLIRIRWS